MMQYEYVAIPDEEVPQARNRLWQHLITTYASETNKTASMWRAVPGGFLDFRPHEKTNTIRTIMVHSPVVNAPMGWPCSNLSLCGLPGLVAVCVAACAS